MGERNEQRKDKKKESKKAQEVICVLLCFPCLALLCSCSGGERKYIGHTGHIGHLLATLTTTHAFPPGHTANVPPFHFPRLLCLAMATKSPENKGGGA